MLAALLGRQLDVGPKVVLRTEEEEEVENDKGAIDGLSAAHHISIC